MYSFAEYQLKTGNEVAITSTGNTTKCSQPGNEHNCARAQPANQPEMAAAEASDNDVMSSPSVQAVLQMGVDERLLRYVIGAGEKFIIQYC